MATDIFVSYAREDEDRIRSLCAALAERGWSVFWDRRIPAGKSWRDYIGRALAEARCVVIAWSRHSVASKYVLKEADEADRRGVLVPVLLDDVEPPFGYRDVNAADLTGWTPGRGSDAFEQFLRDVSSTVGAAVMADTEGAGQESPPPRAAPAVLAPTERPDRRSVPATARRRRWLRVVLAVASALVVGSGVLAIALLAQRSHMSTAERLPAASTPPEPRPVEAATARPPGPMSGGGDASDVRAGGQPRGPPPADARDAQAAPLTTGARASPPAAGAPARERKHPRPAPVSPLRTEPERGGAARAEAGDHAAPDPASAGASSKGASGSQPQPPAQPDERGAPAPETAPPSELDSDPTEPTLESASSSEFALNVEFASAQATREGGEITDVSWSERPDDVSVEPRRWGDGYITCSGRNGDRHWSRWAGFGVDVSIRPGRVPIDASRFKTLMVWLASPTTKTVRITLYGPETRIRENGCYPVLRVKIRPELRLYDFPISRFAIDPRCATLEHRRLFETLPRLVGFQVVDETIANKPSSFTVGPIYLNQSEAPGVRRPW